MQFTPGQYYRTRDGRKARVLATDLTDERYPIAVEISGELERYTNDGHYHNDCRDFRLDLLSPWTTGSTFVFPSGYVPHNPNGLTPEQVGEGWRLLCKEEVDGRYAYGHQGCEVYERDLQNLWTRSTCANIQDNTYRISTTTPLPPLPEPWSCPEDVPGPVCWLRFKHDPIDQRLAVQITDNGITCGCGFFKWHVIGTKCEFSLDRLTWHPCVKGAGR